MTEQEFLRNKEQLDMLMCQKRYDEAQALYKLLAAFIDRVETEAVWEKHTGIKLELAQIYAAIVIETNNKANADEALQKLAAAGDDSYSAFLRARILWMQRKFFASLTLLEKHFMAVADGDKARFSLESPYWQLNAGTKELVLNLLAHGYKFYGCLQLASSLSLESFDVAEFFPTKVFEYCNYLFTAHYLFMPREEYWQAHLRFNDLFKHVKQLKHKKYLHKKHRKIRLGYISPDFRHHVVLLFIWAMLTQYDREKFEVYCFYNTVHEDQYSEYIKKNTDGWVNISGLDFKQAASVIYEHEIDILVELAGHSQHNCLPVLAYKPAPVQVCGIGYFATTGLKTVDYFLSDSYLAGRDSPADDNLPVTDEVKIVNSDWFVEKLLVLPHSHFCYVPLHDMPKPKEAPCRQNGYITFGSFNNLTKVNDTVLQVWVAILQCVPESRLLLKGSLLGDEQGRELIRQKLLLFGLPESRFELRGFSELYLTEYYDMDIALDTFPYPGGGTTCDALYMGVPVITLGDGSHGGNFGISLLKNIGLDFCCAYNFEEYAEKAVQLASDVELVNVLHLGLRNMMQSSPVMDKKLYMEKLEQGYRCIWDRYFS